MKTKIAIIGAGAAGVFCALQILEQNKNVEITFFEKNEPLKSLLPTGGGRCNLSYFENDTYELAKNYPRGEKFLYSVFSKFNVAQTLSYFEKIGIKTYKQADNRLFPTSNSSNDVICKLLGQLEKYKNVRFKKIWVKDAKTLAEYDFIVIATGSKGGYELASTFEHTITPMAPALCGYITEEKYPSGVSILINNTPLLFTHQGISGPYVFKLSSIYAFKKFPFELPIPFLKIEDVMNKIKENPKKSFGNMLCDFVPKSLAKALLTPETYEIQCANIKKSEIQKLETLNFTVIAPDKKGETVRAGGVNLKEIKNTCNSKLHNNLYFIGEILDIDGFCGGFNLQCAWSTAAVCALDILNRIKR